MNCSICTIVRDEAAILPNYLSQIQETDSELIIVDTGSQDNTQEIIESWNIPLFHYAWNQNFSDARNFSIRNASRDWILILDPDETVDLASIDRLLQSPQKDIAALQLTVRNWFPALYIELPLDLPSFRIFRNDPRIRFSGNIGESIEASVQKNSLAVGSADLVIEHFGFILDDFHRLFRNVRLFEFFHNVRPSNEWIQFHLGLQYARIGKIQEAINIILRLVQQRSERVNTTTKAYLIGLLAYWQTKLHKYEDARSMAYRSMQVSGGENCIGELVLAIVDEQAGNYQSALNHLKKIEDRSIKGTGEKVKFAELYKKMAILAFQLKNYKETLLWVAKAYKEGTDGELLTLGGLAAEQMEQYALAVRFYRTAMEYGKNLPFLRERIEECERKMLDNV